MRAVGFSADGKVLYALRSGTGLHSWSFPRLTELPTVELENQNRGEVPFGTSFACGCRFVGGGIWIKGIRVWDAQTGKKMGSLFGHADVPTGFSVSSDAARIISCADDFSIRVWDITGFKQLYCLENLERNVKCVAFSPDGRRFLTGDDKGTVRLHDAETGKELSSYTGHSARVNCVTFALNNTHAASGSDDKTVRLWRLPK